MSIAKELTVDTKREFAQGQSRFHLSLNVRNLSNTIEFLRAMLGCEPSKCRSDYAKFEMDDPPLVLSLEPSSQVGAGNLNHLGFRVGSPQALVDVQRRLELSGIATVREEGVECCYARQTKFWVHDPDGNMWEIYTLDEDIEHRGDGLLPTIQPDEMSTNAEVAAASIWNHRLDEPFPKRLAILDQSVDTVTLGGTLNQRLDGSERSRMLAEVLRILKCGGLLRLHMLTADRDIQDSIIQLPGPASGVKSVPTVKALTEWLESSNFADIDTVFLGKSACFRIGEAELRETRVEAHRA